MRAAGLMQRRAMTMGGGTSGAAQSPCTPMRRGVAASGTRPDSRRGPALAASALLVPRCLPDVPEP